jgi:assimilatory nitrate reductase catalytic subunit
MHHLQAGYGVIPPPRALPGAFILGIRGMQGLWHNRCSSIHAMVKAIHAIKEVKSTCCYCGVGCGVVIQCDGERIVGVRGDPEHPANFGRLCTKGATLHLSAGHEHRALYPEMRLKRDAPRARASWGEALDLVARRFAETILRYGPDSVAFYISGQLLTEDYYVFNKLAKGLIGTNNVDTNSRLCMSSAVAGYKVTLGTDAPPACYEDIALAQCIFIAGSNAAFAHPILFRRIEDAKRDQPELKLIVVDPRRTDTAEAADLHLAILPGTDIALYNAMLHVMLWEDLCDRDFIRGHTEGFSALKTTVQEYTPAAAAAICGVAAEDIVKAARWFANSRGTLSLYCQGLNQSIHGTHNNAALINLHLATGHIGKPGAGPLSLTGQPNAMGGREVGGMANLLSAHRDLADPEHRAEVARLWGVPEVPARPGKTAVELFDALRSGEIKAVWIACTNPAQSMPDANAVHEALTAAEFIVVQEAFRNTDTVAYADVLLPATSWGEKEGTVTNSERRITHVNPAVPGPGEARADWEIAVDFAHRLGAQLPDTNAVKLFPYTRPEQIFREHAQSTRGRDLDITGLSYAVLDSRGPQQWPFPAGATSGTARLYEDGIFPTTDGRARFVDTRHSPPAEDTDARYPLHLNTGRLRDHWHAMSRTGNVARLFNHEPEPLLHLNAEDMGRRSLQDGDLVRVRSRRGELVSRARSSPGLRPGQAFLPMHWGGQFMSGRGVNVLTVPSFDRYSKQPELKHAAVQVEKFEFERTLVALRAAPVGRGAEALAEIRERLQPWLSRFDYATLTFAGREHAVLVLRAWMNQQDAALLAALDAALELDDPERALVFADARRQVAKRALVEGDVLTGVRLAGETKAGDWLKDLMVQRASARPLRPWLLAPIAQPPSGQLTRGRVICNCLDVAEDEILGAYAAGSTLSELQEKLKCGTSCGSCLPELKRLAALAQRAA